jgi:hypothetical protein
VWYPAVHITIATTDTSNNIHIGEDDNRLHRLVMANDQSTLLLRLCENINRENLNL